MFSSRSSGSYASQSERRDSPSRRSSRFSSRKDNRQGGGQRKGSSRKSGRVVPQVDVKES